MKYRHHKYTWENPFSSVRHDWRFVGPLGGLNFHVSITEGYDDSCGVEYHHTDACRSYTNEAPHHVNCPLTGGRCWHDGTSLYASEHVWPVVQTMLRKGDHAAIFRYLERIADEHFEQHWQRPDKAEEDAA